MSHVATIDLDVKDLDALAQAAPRFGMELVRNQSTFLNYGGRQSKCEHALRVAGEFDRGAQDAPYEIGLVARTDGRPGYLIRADLYAGGHGTRERVGPEFSILKREYATVVARKQAIAGGFRVNEQRRADGSIQLTLQK